MVSERCAKVDTWWVSQSMYGPSRGFVCGSRPNPDRMQMHNTLYKKFRRDSIAQWLEHAIADREVACSNHAWVLKFDVREIFVRVLELGSTQCL